ncbi:MAG TPA: hypothetical protein VMH22_10965 [bacterium]|nr:hypothetical protein [bacterium]
MRPRWVMVLLVVSLAGNVAELGVYAWAQWQRLHKWDRFYASLQKDAPTWSRMVVVDSFRPEMRRLENHISRWSVESSWQNFQQPPDTAIDRTALDSIASLTRQEYYLMYQSRRALPGVGDEKLRQRMEKRWRGQMGLGN